MCAQQQPPSTSGRGGKHGRHGEALLGERASSHCADLRILERQPRRLGHRLAALPQARGTRTSPAPKGRTAGVALVLVADRDRSQRAAVRAAGAKPAHAKSLLEDDRRARRRACPRARRAAWRPSRSACRPRARRVPLSASSRASRSRATTSRSAVSASLSSASSAAWISSATAAASDARGGRTPKARPVRSRDELVEHVGQTREVGQLPRRLRAERSLRAD